MRWIALFLLILAPPRGALAGDDSEIEVGGKPDPKDAPDPRDKPLDKEPVPAREPDAKVEWVVVQSANKLVTLQVPSDWRIRERSGKEDEVAFEAMAPGARLPATIDIQSVPGRSPPRSMVQLYVEDAHKRDERAQAIAEPRPHARVEVEGEDPQSMLVIPVRIRGNGFLIRMQTIRREYDLFARDLFGVAERMETSRPDWPVVPESYATRKKGAFVYAVHPSAGDSLKDLQKIAARTEKWFTKFHGKAPKGTVTPVLFLHQSHAQGLALLPSLKDANGVAFGDFSGQRAFFCDFKMDADADRAAVASEIANLCFMRRYGTYDPSWTRRGTATLAGMIEYGNMKPPKLHGGYRGWTDTTTIPSLRDLQRVRREEEAEEWGRQAAYYVLFFHYGPSSYRSAFKKFLEACAETTDADGALEKQLEPIGYDKLRQECDRFRKSKVEYELPK